LSNKNATLKSVAFFVFSDGIPSVAVTEFFSVTERTTGRQIFFFNQMFSFVYF